MRHRKRGRKLGRSPSHQRALLRNLTTCLFLTETQLEPRDPRQNPAKVKGRIVTTLQKAKEVRPFVERCITIAKRSIPAQRRADKLDTDAERHSDEWRSWRASDQYQQWNALIAPVVAARRRVLSLLAGGKHAKKKDERGRKDEHTKQAVQILFDEIAPRFEDRPGGYTRIVRLATPRLGDAGIRAILEFVGVRDRVAEERAEAPKIEPDRPPPKEQATAETQSEEIQSEETGAKDS